MKPYLPEVLDFLKFSRSHVEAFWRCPRLRYLAFHHFGFGIQRAGRMALPLEVGKFTHNTLSSIIIQYNQPPKGDALAAIIRDVLKEEGNKFEAIVMQHFKANPEMDEEFEIQRQRALVEGMVRCWCKVRLPAVFKEFRLVSTELEEDVLLDRVGLGPTTNNQAADLYFMQRRDVILEPKRGGPLQIMEFKTAGKIDEKYIQAWNYDNQCLSHLLQARVMERPASVLVEALYKGWTRKTDGIHFSTLIRGFKKQVLVSDPIVGDDEWQTQYEWKRWDPDRRPKTLTPKQGWEPFYVWDEQFAEKPSFMSNVEYWVEHVLDHEELLANLASIEVSRTDKDIEQWLHSTVLQEKGVLLAINEINEYLRDVEENHFDTPQPDWTYIERKILDKHFPARRGTRCWSGDYGKSCPMVPVCFRQGEPGVPHIDMKDALTSGVYVKRFPHHEQEFRP